MKPTTCYCDKEIIELCKDLLTERIPSEALMRLLLEENLQGTQRVTRSCWTQDVEGTV